MLHLFYGSGPKQIKIEKLTKALGGEVLKINDLDFSLERLKELASARSLFAEKMTIVLSNVLEKEGSAEEVSDFLEELAGSPNTFIFIENEVTSTLLLAFKENGETILVDGKKESKPAFNIFSLTDAFGGRDKKKAWLLFIEATKFSAPEEIAQMIFWQIKNMLLVKRAKGGENLGLNPYVAKKAGAASQKFTILELKNLSRKLVGIFHESRRTGRDLAVSLEKLILEAL
jgi:DNA polymerase III delta subunit